MDLMVIPLVRRSVVAVSTWTNPNLTPASNTLQGRARRKQDCSGIPLEVGSFPVSDKREAAEHNIIALPNEEHVDTIRA